MLIWRIDWLSFGMGYLVGTVLLFLYYLLNMSKLEEENKELREQIDRIEEGRNN